MFLTLCSFLCLSQTYPLLCPLGQTEYCNSAWRYNTYYFSWSLFLPPFFKGMLKYPYPLSVCIKEKKKPPQS